MKNSSIVWTSSCRSTCLSVWSSSRILYLVINIKMKFEMCDSVSNHSDFSNDSQNSQLSTADFMTSMGNGSLLFTTSNATVSEVRNFRRIGISLYFILITRIWIRNWYFIFWESLIEVFWSVNSRIYIEVERISLELKIIFSKKGGSSFRFYYVFQKKHWQSQFNRNFLLEYLV